MDISIDIKNIFVTKLLKPGTEFKIILPKNLDDDITAYLNDEKIISGISISFNFENEINLNRRY